MTNLSSAHRRTVALAVAAVAVVCSSGAVLAATTEDVTQHNGLSTSDPAHLRLFVDHRNTTMVIVAKTVTTFGAPPLLAVLAVLAAAVLWWRGARLIVAAAPAIALATAG